MLPTVRKRNWRSLHGKLIQGEKDQPRTPVDCFLCTNWCCAEHPVWWCSSRLLPFVLLSQWRKHSALSKPHLNQNWLAVSTGLSQLLFPWMLWALESTMFFLSLTHQSFCQSIINLCIYLTSVHVYQSIFTYNFFKIGLLYSYLVHLFKTNSVVIIIIFWNVQNTFLFSTLGLSQT